LRDTLVVIKELVKLRQDPEVLVALRAAGDGWQTRISMLLRASQSLAGGTPSPCCRYPTAADSVSG
jgi:hypothetical protein